MDDAQTDAPTLLPCPFCGGVGKLGSRDGRHSVRCQDCYGRGRELELPAAAIAEWNRRAALASPRATPAREEVVAKLAHCLRLALPWIKEQDAITFTQGAADALTIKICAALDAYAFDHPEFGEESSPSLASATAGREKIERLRLAESHPATVTFKKGYNEALDDVLALGDETLVASAVKRGPFGGVKTTTLCGRVATGTDGMNIDESKDPRAHVTCKFCRRHREFGVPNGGYAYPAEYAASATAAWRPIETAPRDGTHILVTVLDRGGFGYCGGKRQDWCAVVHYWPHEGEEGFYLSTGATGFDDRPMDCTHWTPLPTERSAT